jgi:hypothetical protein
VLTLSITPPGMANLPASVQPGTLLRGRPAVRIGFVIYIALVHLYMVFVFYYFMHHLPTHVEHT